MSAFRTLIPPKIASAQALAGASSAQRMQRVVEFYSKVRPITLRTFGNRPEATAIDFDFMWWLQLPKGAPAKASGGLNPWARYKARYVDGDAASGAVLVHVMALLFLTGCVDVPRSRLGWLLTFCCFSAGIRLSVSRLSLI